MSSVAIEPRLWVPTPAAEILLPDLPKWAREKLGKILLMSGSKSNYSSKKVLEELLGGVAYTSAANTYLGLWTAALDDTSTGSTGSEATYGSYARTLIGTANNQTDAWNAATGTTTATVTNKNAINCPTSTSGSNTITYVAILDASTTGNILYWASISSTAIATGDTPVVNAGSLSVVED